MNSNNINILKNVLSDSKNDDSHDISRDTNHYDEIEKNLNDTLENSNKVIIIKKNHGRIFK